MKDKGVSGDYLSGCFLLELSILVGETRWQLSEIIHEANRRLGDPQHTKEVERTPLMRWIERSEDILSIH